jgi:hypothetical protein
MKSSIIILQVTNSQQQLEDRGAQEPQSKKYTHKFLQHKADTSLMSWETTVPGNL